MSKLGIVGSDEINDPAGLLQPTPKAATNTAGTQLEALIVGGDVRLYCAAIFWPDDTNLSQGNTSLTGANLLNAILRFTDLRGAKLDTNTLVNAKTRLIWQIVNEGAPGRDLHGLDLSEAILAEGNLRNANLTNVNFSRSFLNFADLSGADLTGATLLNADLTEANLTGANLTRANLRGAQTTDTDFSGAVFSNTIMPDGSTRSN